MKVNKRLSFTNAQQSLSLYDIFLLRAPLHTYRHITFALVGDISTDLICSLRAVFIVNCNITIFILLATAMEAPDFDVDAFDGGLCCINADGANAAVVDVIEQDKSILDQFDDDGLDFDNFD